MIQHFFILSIVVSVSASLLAQNLELYDLKLVKHTNDTAALVSFSGMYESSEFTSDRAIPNVEGKRKEDVEYFILSSTYRKRFLYNMKISETDKVFVYDYSTSTLVSFPVKILNVVASLYGANEPHSPHDYRIGFEIRLKFLKDFDKYFSNTLVYVGKENPFILGQLKAPTWKKIDPKTFPAISLSPDKSLWLSKENRVAGDAYQYRTAQLNYYVQEYTTEPSVSARHLLVLDVRTKEIVYDEWYANSEECSILPLNDGKNIREACQWTGMLFKNKPPVIFGFERYPFGCSGVSILKLEEESIPIHCDNRH